MYYIILIFILLISQHYFLLNEEFLILVSFTIFLSLTFNQTHGSVINSFYSEYSKIKQTLLNSFQNLTTQFKNYQVWQKKLQLTNFYFNYLKQYYLKVNNHTIKQLTHVYSTQKNEIFLQKLKYIQELEIQFSKLIIIMIIDNITRITLINKFCAKKLKINQFNCFSKISIRESLNNL
nr:ATP synthase F0 subunit b [Pleonosporium sp.]